MIYGKSERPLRCAEIHSPCVPSGTWVTGCSGHIGNGWNGAPGEIRTPDPLVPGVFPSMQLAGLLIIDYYFDIFRIMKSNDAIESLAALAQESRLAIFRMLVKRGPEGYTPTQLGEKLNVTSPTLSFHLKELQRAGLLDVRREGRFLYYRPNFAHMNQLIGFLTENCCILADKDCGPECAAPAADAPLTKRQRA
jgi:ArsR family transcriptional regulator, arsenate/arsenite/antimonite-responsive transcriptional repressor